MVPGRYPGPRVPTKSTILSNLEIYSISILFVRLKELGHVHYFSSRISEILICNQVALIEDELLCDWHSGLRLYFGYCSLEKFQLILEEGRNRSENIFFCKVWKTLSVLTIFSVL